MTHSLSPHCILSEPSRETMSGKGREGNKEGKGRRVETYTTSLSESTRERFWRSVDITPACWLWIGHVTPKGYGRFSDGRRLVMVHRFSYELVNGEVPKGLEVGHLCHVRNCVNPEHLQAMTHAENVHMALERRGRTTAMTHAERKRRWYLKNRESLREKNRAKRDATGWWVCI